MESFCGSTRGRINERHILDDGVCGQCSLALETIVHAIFECSLVSQIWQNSAFAQYIMDSPKNSFLDMFLWIKSQLDITDALSFAALAWAAWSYRNSVVHNEVWSNVEVGAVSFLRSVTDYGAYAAAVLKRG